MAPTVRDRTQEFFATVGSFQELGHIPARSKTNSVSSSTSPSNIKLSKTSIEQSSRIRNLANQIAESIDEVQQKIVQLEQLAKLTSNFRDERPKIQSLMLSIKQDIDRLNMDLKTLETFLSQSFNDITSSKHNCIEHHQSLFKVLQSRYSNLAKSFGTACEISTKHLQRQKKQREKFGFGANKKKSYRKVPLNRLQKRRNARHNGGTSSETEALLGNDNLLEATGGGHQLKGASQSQSQMVLYQESQYNEQRAMEAEHIEGQLTEISQMMTKLANIVDEQRQTIIQIGDNVDDAREHVEGAIEQLQKYLSSLSGNRWLMIKVFALLIFLAIIFTVFIA